MAEDWEPPRDPAPTTPYELPPPLAAPPDRARRGRVLVAVGIAAAALLGVVIWATVGTTGGGGSGGTTTAVPASTRGATTAPGRPPTPTPTPARGTPTPSRTAATTGGVLPNLVGSNLQAAQDAAQHAGFRTPHSHDALGRGRHQLLDRDWTVCSQQPAAGRHPTTTTIDVGVVQTDESCPATDRSGAAPKPGATMPDYRGRAANVARRALADTATVRLEDVSGKDRTVIVESHWQVCSTTPAAGRPYQHGATVTFHVVKFGETCP